MRRIKPFDSISESIEETKVYVTKLASYKQSQRPTQIDLYNEPKYLKYATVTEGTAGWTLDLKQREWGIELGPDGARLKYISMTIEVDSPHSEEPEKDTIELTEDQFSPDSFKTEIHKFPLDLDAIEIDMKNSDDPKLWVITLNIGRISEY